MQIATNNLANGTETPTAWHSIDWKKAYRQVRNLRQRIFRAQQQGNLKKVHSLQKLMLRSYSNRLISVRRVTQINAGKKTPGVDKVVVKTPAARGRLVDELANYSVWKAKPTRRIYIPKSNGKLRPLSIPVITDRAIQSMVLNALEPSWECRFEASSYGFRPGRSCHDAIQKIYGLARPNKRKQWILDADLRGAFDNISQEFLLKVLGPVPGKELIKQWLKAGYLDKVGTFHQTESGTPQGGVVSPLLLNVTLHGMEAALGVKYDYRGQLISKRAVVKYADDLVIFCESQQDAEAAKETLVSWLKERGLTFAEEKTRIVHLTDGFNFLGFNVRHYPSPQTTKSGWKLLIKPSKEATQKIRDRLKQEWLKLRGQSVAAIVARLNPIIRGWCNYHRRVVAKEVFHSLDCWMFRREVRYVKHTHPHKPRYWTDEKYWGKLNLDRQDYWVFGDKKTGHHLLKFGWFPIEYPVLVRGTASPDDPQLKGYWQERRAAKVKDLTASRQKIAQRQKGCCPVCGESLYNDEELHIHHKIPKAKGGKNNYGNLVLLHLYCHQKVHSKDHNESQAQLCPGSSEAVMLESQAKAKKKTSTVDNKKSVNVKEAPVKKELRK